MNEEHTVTSQRAGTTSGCGPRGLLAALLIAAILLPIAWEAALLAQPTTRLADPYDDGFHDESAVEFRKLAKEEISRIRFMELRAMRMRTTQPDRVQVDIPNEVVDEFLVEMQGHPDFEGRQSPGEFRKLTPPQKLHAFAAYRGAAYADRVKINTDPEVFVQFRKQVLPIVLRNCATSGCHSAHDADERPFRLFNDPKKTPGAVYADFIMIDGTQVNGEQLINRTHPERSLLLTFLLPPKDVRPELRHPGDKPLTVLFQSRGAPGYRRIERWIRSLKHPAEDYGVRFSPRVPLVTDDDEPPVPDDPPQK